MFTTIKPRSFVIAAAFLAIIAYFAIHYHDAPTKTLAHEITGAPHKLSSAAPQNGTPATTPAAAE